MNSKNQNKAFLLAFFNIYLLADAVAAGVVVARQACFDQVLVGLTIQERCDAAAVVAVVVVAAVAVNEDMVVAVDDVAASASAYCGVHQGNFRRGLVGCCSSCPGVAVVLAVVVVVAAAAVAAVTYDSPSCQEAHYWARPWAAFQGVVASCLLGAFSYLRHRTCWDAFASFAASVGPSSFLK